MKTQTTQNLFQNNKKEGTKILSQKRMHAWKIKQKQTHFSGAIKERKLQREASPADESRPPTWVYFPFFFPLGFSSKSLRKLLL